MLCNCPLFGVVMCCFAGATLMVIGAKVNNIAALVFGIIMFVALVMLVHYDVETYPTVHLGSLLRLLIASTVFFTAVHLVDRLLIPYYGMAVICIMIVPIQRIYNCYFILVLIELGWVVLLLSYILHMGA